MIIDAAQITPEWLSALLRDEGALGVAGSVTAVHIEPREDVWNSKAYRLRPAYSGNASGAPARLFLKLKGDHWGREEAQFYTYLRSTDADLPMLVPCFGAEYDPATGHSQ